MKKEKHEHLVSFYFYENVMQNVAISVIKDNKILRPSVDCG